jgi:ketosteroid isomerase-like protein
MRLRVISGILLTAALFVRPAASHPPVAGAAPDPAIVKIADAYVKASLAGDVKGIVALYADDAVEMPPNEPAIKGRAAIEQYYVKQLAMSKLSAFSISHLDSVASGNVGYDVGTYTQTVMLKDGKSINATGKYTVILRRSGADWKVVYAIYNSDQPPMAPAPK